jgi:hypothetical protein
MSLEFSEVMPAQCDGEKIYGVETGESNYRFEVELIEQALSVVSAR